MSADLRTLRMEGVSNKLHTYEGRKQIFFDFSKLTEAVFQNETIDLIDVCFGRGDSAPSLNLNLVVGCLYLVCLYAYIVKKSTALSKTQFNLYDCCTILPVKNCGYLNVYRCDERN